MVKSFVSDEIKDVVQGMQMRFDSFEVCMIDFLENIMDPNLNRITFEFV